MPKKQKKEIKPALLVIDIQNTYLQYIPDADKDADRDGSTNLEEYMAGSDPTHYDPTEQDLVLRWTNTVIRGPTRGGEYTIVMKIAIENQGNDTFPEGTLMVCVSSDPDLDSGDTLIGEVSIPPIKGGYVKTKRVRGRVALNTTAPRIYFIACAQSGRQASIPAVEEVQGGVDLGVELLGLDKSGPNKRGEYTVRGSISATNTGHLPSGKCEFQVYSSADEIFDGADIALFEKPKVLPKLLPGNRRARSFSYTVGEEAGGGYLIIKVDSGDSIQETDEANNEIAQPRP